MILGNVVYRKLLLLTGTAITVLDYLVAMQINMQNFMANMPALVNLLLNRMVIRLTNGTETDHTPLLNHLRQARDSPEHLEFITDRCKTLVAEHPFGKAKDLMNFFVQLVSSTS